MAGPTNTNCNPSPSKTPASLLAQILCFLRGLVTNNAVNVNATLDVGDIEIGAVELKNASTDERASIEAANTVRTNATKVLAVQHVDAAGNVLPAAPVLGAGAAIVGLVGIDQTTPGTTNAVFVKNGMSFSIPAFDYQAFTYVGATNNVSTIVFKSGGSGGATVATLTFTYVAAGAADDDDVATITQS